MSKHGTNLNLSFKIKKILLFYFRAAIQEDERGILQTNVTEFDNQNRRRQMLCKESNIRLSMASLFNYHLYNSMMIF